MARLLRIGTFLATALLASCLLLLVAGLAMGARPEIFTDLGLKDAGKTGFVLALVAGIGAIASTVFIQILHLVLDNIGDEIDAYGADREPPLH